VGCDRSLESLKDPALDQISIRNRQCRTEYGPAVRFAVIEAIVRPWLTTIDVDHEVDPALTTSG
jgi:hypothetical protein